MVCKQIKAVSIRAAKRQFVQGWRNWLRELFRRLGRAFEALTPAQVRAQARAQSEVRARGVRCAIAGIGTRALFGTGTFWAVSVTFACAAFVGVFWVAGTLGVAARKSNDAMVRVTC